MDYSKLLLELYLFIFLIPFIVIKVFYWGSISYFQTIPIRQVLPIFIGVFLRILIITIGFSLMIFLYLPVFPILLGIASGYVEGLFIKKLPEEFLDSKSLFRSTLVSDLLFGIGLIAHNLLKFNSQGLG